MPNAPSTATEPRDSSAGTLDVPDKNAPGSQPLLAEAIAATAAKTTPVQLVLSTTNLKMKIYENKSFHS